MITDRDHARQLIKEAGITVANVTEHQLWCLFFCLEEQLVKSGKYGGTYAMSDPNNLMFTTCRTDQWREREAVSFNRDGFIGIAGWADESNVRPMLNAIEQWLDNIKRINNVD